MIRQPLEFVYANAVHGYTLLVSLNSTQQTIINDLFTGTNGTNLTAHTPNTDVPGGAWNTGGGGSAAWTIQSNAMQVTGVMNGGTAWINGGNPNGAITAVFNFLTSGANPTFGILFRYADASDLWICELDKHNQALSIYEDAASVFTQRASTAMTISASTPYTVKLIMSGSTLTATANGGNLTTYGSAASGLTAKNHGFWVSSYDAGSYTFNANSFKFTNP
jgi:hypothetical protein